MDLTEANPGADGLASQIAIVTHHKSGTVASADLISALCFPECDAGHMDSGCWAAWEVTGKARCAAVGVRWLTMGFLLSQEVEGYLEKSPSVVHFIRDPASMVVSGYKYHMKCSEDWTYAPLSLWPTFPQWESTMAGSANTLATIKQILGAHAHATNASYCELLQAASAEQGVAAETVRALEAADGVGAMLDDVERLRELNATGRLSLLFNMCMSDYEPPNTEHANATWRELVQALQMDRPVAVHYDVSHTSSTNSSDATDLEAIAKGELLRRRPSALALDACRP